MWYNNAVFYQIYPLGFCGAERENDFASSNKRLHLIEEHIPSMRRLGVNALQLSPVFESVTHGYDTVDYSKVDRRLGTNAELASMIKRLHDNGIRVVLDAVFNHVGRNFEPFLDVIRNKSASRYKNWFRIDFESDGIYGDGFWYEGWEGHYELVKLNLTEPEVRAYLITAAKRWINEFDIDGLRLDVCYLLPLNFLHELKSGCCSQKSDFFIFGEVIHGDYNRYLGQELVDSVTNYECYKGLYSSVNDKNLFEIAHSLNRQFGDEPWSLYRGRNLINFLDNHDCTRIYTIIREKRNILNLYTLLFTIPGIPMIYYGSEYGAEGGKRDSDYALRPSVDSLDKKAHPEIGDHIGRLSELKKTEKALSHGSYKTLHLTNTEFAFRREFDGETIIVMINISDEQKSVLGETVPAFGCCVQKDGVTVYKA